MVGRTSQRSGIGREALLGSGSGLEVLPEVRKWSGGTFGGPAEVESPSRRSRSVREALSEVQEWSGVPPEGPKVVGSLSLRFGSGL